MKKILSCLLVAILIFSMSVPVGAASNTTTEENNAKIAAVTAELENKYGITISYRLMSNGAAEISLYNLETLDLAFSSVTPNLVKQISSYYQNRNGSKINIEYIFADSDYSMNGSVLMAAFERATSNIYVFMPSKAGKAVISGENPIAIVHELGHAFHYMCADSYGMSKMYKEWSEFNGGNAYKKGDFTNPDRLTFISGYAANSFEEDFAEIFGHTFARNVAGTGFKGQLSKNSQTTNLGKKVNYVEKMISTYISNSEQAIKNYRRIYQTPSSITFEGVTFSGEYLQYIGYPQPKNILKGITNGLKITPKKSVWIRSLGAWRVIDQNDIEYFLFPGASWTSAEIGLIEVS